MIGALPTVQLYSGTIRCCAAGHADRQGQPGWADVLGTIDGATDPDAAWGHCCDACADTWRAWIQTGQAFILSGSAQTPAQWVIANRAKLAALVQAYVAAHPNPVPALVARWMAAKDLPPPLHAL